jgi:hypothetical protein
MLWLVKMYSKPAAIAIRTMNNSVDVSAEIALLFLNGGNITETIQHITEKFILFAN